MPRLKLLPLAVCLLATGTSAADRPSTKMLRTPTLNATHIAFAYANNIWMVERAGGTARRVTSSQSETVNPNFSPNGRWLAFSAGYAGNRDVYVVPAEGGEPRRLTWHPGDDTVQGWTHDSQAVLFTSGRATKAPGAALRFWTVPVEGGVEEPLPLPRGYQGEISPDGARIAYRMNSSWDEERRNYRGGQNRPVWIVDLKTFDLVSPPWTDSKDMDPVWAGGAVYFISDRDGVANVWSYHPGTKKLTQHTRYTDFDVKSLGSNGDAVVFEQAGGIHELDAKSGKVRDVPITVHGDFPWMMPRWQDVASRLASLTISPTGKRLLAEARGEVFTVPVEKGDVRNLSNSSGSAERSPAWSPDGKWISYFSDRSGEYKLILEEPEGLKPPREVALPKPNFYYTPAWSPDSKKLLYTDTNLNVWVLDVESGNTKVVGRDPWMVPSRTLNPTWSPDSKWIAYASRLKSMYHAIFVAHAETGESRQITDGLADSVWPVWDASGKYLWFFASTDFGLRSQWLDMTSYDRQTTFGLYLAVLKKGEPSPLLPESDEDKGITPGRPPQGEGERAKPAPVTVTIDFENIHQRIIPVAEVPQRQYTLLRPGVAGTVFFLELPRDAAAGRADPRQGVPPSTLHRYRLSDRKPAAFVSGVASFDVSADGRKLVYRTGGGPGGPPQQRGQGGGAGAAAAVFVVDADRTAPQAGQGRVNFALRMYLEPREEFKQMFYEGWRLQRDYLYVPNMHGADWVRMKEMYGQFLPHVNHRADLNYLLDMMGGEIAVGHSYVRGGDIPSVPGAPGGLLGADFKIENGRYRIARIYDGESWNPDLRAPLAAPGVDVSTGDYILAIGGVELRAPDNIYRLLDGTANRQTVLTVNSTPSLEGARQVKVVPVPSEAALRSRAWVEANRRLVDKLSGGKLAYVHLPNTGTPGYESFNRYYFAQQDREGAVIDERYNGGGSAADYIIEVLQRTFDGYFNNVAGERYPFTSPSAGIWGPKVMIINEMAGSGGDLMPWMFRYRKIGPLVGKRTWGGLVHTADTPQLVDGGTMIAPRGGFFTREGKWAVENEGTAPDIDVENWPKDEIAGRDAQLEKAVEEAMRLLKANPVKRLSAEPPPPLWGERKSPR
ncbi:MAG: PDZ domain-containing protein [Bryobacteraceae bacterium]|nr:PDZ domain-containing protein [Bryobacteraceae bacterium]